LATVEALLRSQLASGHREEREETAERAVPSKREAEIVPTKKAVKAARVAALAARQLGLFDALAPPPAAKSTRSRRSRNG
jgi:hypothetical protein